MEKPIIKIVRIEHPSDGKGFFRSEDEEGNARDYNHSKFDNIRRRHNNEKKFPNYYDDEEISSQIDYDDVQEYKFAFRTLDQLKEGFTNHELKEAIEKLGFRILLLSVDDYYESKFQVVFKNPIESEDISSLFI